MLSFADLHCDTLLSCYENQTDLSYQTLHINGQYFQNFERYIQVFAHFIPEETPHKWDFFQSFLKNSFKVLEKSKLPIMVNAADLKQRHLALLSVEGGDFFENETQILPRVSFLKENNIAFFSLIYNHKNALGCGCADKIDTGLTPLGKKVLKALEEKGIIPDVSHASFKSTKEILELSSGPVCATHSNAFDLTPHRRNLCKEHLHAIAQSGGLVGVNLYPPFLSARTASVDDIFRHVDYLINCCGENAVVFGCDFDGVDKLPQGIYNLSSIESVYLEFERRGYSQSVIEKLFYKNVYEFLKENFGG